jgi:hypothetical protein
VELAYQKTITGCHRQIPHSGAAALTVVDVYPKFTGSNRVIVVRAETILTLARGPRTISAHISRAATLLKNPGAVCSHPCLATVAGFVRRST